MEGVQKTTTCKGDLNPESGVYGGIRDAGEVFEILKVFTSAEIRSLSALCDAYFPSLTLEASGLVLDDSYCRKDVEEFYRASFPDGGGALQVRASQKFETMLNIAIVFTSKGGFPV